MKKLVFTSAIVLFIQLMSLAQSVTVGTGTSNNLYGPIYIYSMSSTNTHSWNLSIYTQSELATNGATAGTISSIGWYKNDAGGYLGNDASFEIFIKPTTLANFGAGAASFDVESVGATLVYSSTTVGLPTSTGWVDFTLNTPYSWNGTDNLMILTRWVRPGAGTAAVNWAGTPGFAPPMVSHSFSATSTMGSLYTTANRPNIRFTLTPLGLQNLQNEAAILVYPNPAKEEVQIQNKEGKALGQISLFNAEGQLLFNESSNQSKSKIQLSNYPKGIYSLQVKNNKSTITKRLVKVE